MCISDEVGTDEKVGHSIKSKNLRRACRKKKIHDMIFEHIEFRREMSVDRVSLAERNGDMQEIVDAAKGRVGKHENRSFQGWVMFCVSWLIFKSCEVKSAKIIDQPDMVDNRYHANVLIPEAYGDEEEDKEGFVQMLLHHYRCETGWKTNPELLS